MFICRSVCCVENAGCTENGTCGSIAKGKILFINPTG
jgi:hypothetical protein